MDKGGNNNQNLLKTSLSIEDLFKPPYDFFSILKDNPKISCFVAEYGPRDKAAFTYNYFINYALRREPRERIDFEFHDLDTEDLKTVTEKILKSEKFLFVYAPNGFDVNKDVEEKIFSVNLSRIELKI